MAISITYTDGTMVLAKDIAPSKHTREQINATVAAAKHNPTHKAFTFLSMADNTNQPITVSIR